MFNAYYITRVSLPGWLVVWTPNLLVWGSNPLSNKRFFKGTVLHWLYCNAFNRALTRVNYVIYREKSAIYRQNHLYIARYRRYWGISPEISPDRYFSMKYHVDLSRYTIYRRHIVIFSSLILRKVNLMLEKI